MFSVNEASESVTPFDTIANDVDVVGADALNAPTATTPKFESGVSISREEADELLHDNPESTVAEIEEATKNLSPGTKGGFDSETREVIRTAKRVAVKIGPSLLTGSGGRTSPERIDLTTDAPGKRMGISDIIVVSFGVVASGMGPLGLISRPSDSATEQVAAAMGQVRLAQEWGRSFLRCDCISAQVPLISDDAGVRSCARNARRTIDHLCQLGVVPIVNENDTVAISEFHFGDNDRLVVLVSHLAYCDTLTLLFDVDGLYDRNLADPDATFVPEVRSGNDPHSMVAGDGGALGTGGMASKVSAARPASRAGVPVLLTSASNTERALDQADTGTAFFAKESRSNAWKFWMLCAADSSGLLRLDAGVVDTVTCMRKSLLPAGITTADGESSAGDIVDLIGSSGEVIGRGEVNYDSEELLGMIGYHIEELPNDMQKPVVHADHLSDFASRVQESIVLRAAALKNMHIWVRLDRNVSAKDS